MMISFASIVQAFKRYGFCCSKRVTRSMSLDALDASVQEAVIKASKPGYKMNTSVVAEIGPRRLTPTPSLADMPAPLTRRIKSPLSNQVT